MSSGRVAVGEEHALGDFELEPVGTHARFVEVPGNDADDGRVVELQRRQIDRDPDMVRPARGFLQRGAEHPLADAGR